MAKKKKYKHPPRDIVSREERYMGMAWMWASMSKDPSTQVGSVIISSDNRPLGSGYNGPPKSITDSEIDWSRPEKYPFIVHAEQNAIDYCSEKPKGATIYVSGVPCSVCMLAIAKAGIYKVIYHDLIPDKNSMMSRAEDWEITQRIAKLSGIQLEKFKGNNNWIRDWIEDMYEKGAFD